MKEEVDKDLLYDVFRAYMDARKNKRNTVNQLQFEMNLESNLIELAAQIQNRTYKVGRSVCFIVENPVKREIFAADFRDRVVHHLIFNYINPVFEKQLIEDCYSCRKGFGTSKGIQRMEHHLRSVTNNYTRRAYVLKLDLQGYFMSINRAILYEKVHKALSSRKNRRDKNLDLELYLLHEIIFNEPTDGCLKKGDIGKWEGLPNSKSLFYSPEGCGLPIGNLTSQLFSNIYLCDFDNYVKRELKMKHYGRYVDDFFILHTDKRVLLDVLAKISVYLERECGLTIHPRKIYLQEIRKGVAFLGAYFKPFRQYVSKRTAGTMRQNVRHMNRDYPDKPTRDSLIRFQSSMNSHLGHLGQFDTYNMRRELWDGCGVYKDFFRLLPCRTKIKPRKMLLTVKDG